MRRVLALVPLLVSLGCWETAVRADAGSLVDAGSEELDSGSKTAADSGSNTVVDSGSNAVDSGAADAGATGGDAGLVVDAGRRDAGVFDAGPFDPGHSDAGKNPRYDGLGDHSAIDLGAFACTEVSGNNDCQGVTGYSGFTYDSNHHQLLMFGGGHATTMTDTVFAFDLTSTLAWRELYQPTPCDLMTPSNLDAALGAWKAGASGPYPRPLSAHTYDQVAFSPAANDFMVIGRHFTGGYCSQVGNDVGGPPAHLSFTTQQWSFASVPALADLDASELDPVSGKIVLFGGAGLKLYDPLAKTMTVVIDTYNGEKLKDPQGQPVDMGALGYANSMTYFPPNDTFYFFVRGSSAETWALKLDRATPKESTLQHVATTGPASGHDEPSYAYDSRNHVIGGGVKGNTFYVFDPSTAAWSAETIIGGSPGEQAFHALGYDPVNNVFLFLSHTSPMHTWAFRYR